MLFYDEEELRTTELMPIDTDCKFECGPGFYMIGSPNRNCLPLSKWDGLQTNCKRIYRPNHILLLRDACGMCPGYRNNMHSIHVYISFKSPNRVYLFTIFAEIFCAGLPPVEYGQYDTTECTNLKVMHGTSCTLKCNEGFDAKGPTSKICGGKRSGIWSHRNKLPKCIGEHSI